MPLTLHWPQVDAATSIASGDISYDNVHKAIFGFNQATEGRRLLSEAVKVGHSMLCHFCRLHLACA